MASRSTQALEDEIETATEKLKAWKESLAGPLTASQQMTKILQDQLAVEKKKLDLAEEAAKLQADVAAKARANLAATPVVGGVLGAVVGGIHNVKETHEQGQAAGGGMAAGFNDLAAGLGMVTGVAGAVVGAFQSIISSSVGFVEAFAPSNVLVLNQAIGDLTATIGMALVPVVQAASGFISEFGSALLPVMEQLRPVVQQLADTFTKVAGMALANLQPVFDALVPLGEAFAAVWEATAELLEPFMAIGAIINEITGAALKIFALLIKELVRELQPIITLFRMVGDVLRAVTAVFGAVMDSLIGAFGGGEADGLKNACDEMRKSFQQVIKAGVIMAAAMMKLFGMHDAVDKLKKRLSGPERKPIVGMKAGTNASFSGFAELGRQVSQSASIADGSGKSDDKKEVDFLKEIADEIGKFDSMTLQGIITAGVRAALPGMPTHAGRPAAGASSGAAAGAESMKNGGSATGAFFKGMIGF
jgi:hypothetical protein